MDDGMLIVCGQRKFAGQLLAILSGAVAGTHSIAVSGAEARRKTGLSDFDAVLVCGRLPDEDYLDLAADLAAGGCKGVIVVVERASLYDAHDVLDGTGVLILAQPLTRDSLQRAVQLMVKAQVGGGTLEKAKLMLMQRRGWSEPQAHRYIQKISMDKRLPRDVTAQLIIRALEKEQEPHP